MKKPIITTFVLLAFVAVTSLYGQNVVYETIYLKPKTDKLKEFGEAVKAHNEKYHGEGAYSAGAWQVISGPHSGMMFWVMGPFTFADLDNRPSEGGHDDDWMGNVMPHTHGMTDGYYWRQWNDYGYMPSENFSGKIMRALNWKVKPGKREELRHAMSAIQKVYDANSMGHSMAIFSNWTSDGEIDVAIVWQYENWAYLDEDLEFSKKYEEVHGDNSWNTFQEAMRDYVEFKGIEMFQRME